MIILVCGGRAFSDQAGVFSALDRLKKHHSIDKVVHGAARGADELGGAWARARGVEEAAYPARWDSEGPSAGPKRNQRMLDNEAIDVIVAFPGGRGTEDMVRRGTQAGIKVWRPYP